MKVFLSKQCEHLVGSLGRGFGYCIESRRKKNGELYHYLKRNAKGAVPPDGHWQCIAACAFVAKHQLQISDIKIHWTELSDALYEAGKFAAHRQVRQNGVEGIKLNYNAADIMNLKIMFGL